MLIILVVNLAVAYSRSVQYDSNAYLITSSKAYLLAVDTVFVFVIIHSFEKTETGCTTSAWQVHAKKMTKSYPVQIKRRVTRSLFRLCHMFSVSLCYGTELIRGFATHTQIIPTVVLPVKCSCPLPGYVSHILQTCPSVLWVYPSWTTTMDHDDNHSN